MRYLIFAFEIVYQWISLSLLIFILIKFWISHYEQYFQMFFNV